MASIHGTLALVGSGEYLPQMEGVDKHLLERLGTSPRVVVLPTAATPDGRAIYERWATQGVEHFTRLGAPSAACMMLTHADAEKPEIVEQIAGANFIYFSGGKPRYLLETLRNTAAWKAIKDIFLSGGVIAGCSAGAMVMGEFIFDLPHSWRTLPALALVPNVAVVPHFDEIPALLTSTLARATRQANVVGIDGNTALIWTSSHWSVQGSGRVTVFTPRQRNRYTAGERVPLAQLKQP